MYRVSLKMLVGAAACSLFLAACSSDGITFGAGGGGFSGGGGSGGGGSGGGSGGSGGGGSGGGSGGGGSSPTTTSFLGNGEVIVTGDGTTVGTPPLLTQLQDAPAVGPVVSTVTETTESLLATGNATLPTVVQPVATAVQPVTSGLPLSSRVSDVQVSGGTAAQPLGVGVLSKTPATGSVAAVNLLSGGKTATISVAPAGLDSAKDGLTGGPIKTVLQNQQITGGQGTQPIGLGIASTNAQQGSVASANVLSGGQLVGANVSQQGLSNTVNSLTSGVSGSNNLLSGVTGAVGGSGNANATADLLGNLPLVGGNAQAGANANASGGLPILGTLLQ